MSVIHLPYTRQCFVCGAENPAGLQLRFRVEGDEIRFNFCPHQKHTGYQGVVHGGIIASALDETMFWAAAFGPRRFFVSVDMNVRYARTVVAGQPHVLVARITGAKRKLCLTEAELRTADGHVCASATGTFFPLKPGEIPLSLEDFVIDPQTLPAMEFFKSFRFRATS